MTLSTQAIGSIMMALQKAIMNQEDVTKILRAFEFGASEENELVVNNPPTVQAQEVENEDS
jgi:hypothetical protein|tara:strand:- start:3041 stop:3223 length:183 start_codon:yes stop_codon:yes gene_type:complete